MSFLKAQVSFPLNVASVFSAIKHNFPILFLVQEWYTLFKRSPLKWHFLRFSSKSRQNSSNSSCQFWSDKSIPLQILHHSSLPWHKTPLEILSWYIVYFRSKDPIEVPFFRPCNLLRWKFAKFLMSFFKAQVSFPSNVASIFSTIKHNSPIPFLAQALYSFFKRSPLKCNFLKCLSTWVKIFQIPYVSFDLAAQFLFKFFTIPHCHDTKVPCKY